MNMAVAKPVVGESLARGLISRWRKRVNDEYNAVVHSEALDDFYPRSKKRSKTIKAMNEDFERLTYAVLHMEKRIRKGKPETVVALISPSKLNTDRQLGIELVLLDRKGRSKGRHLPFCLTEHYLIRVVQANRCRCVEKVRDAVAEILFNFLNFNSSQERVVPAPDRYGDDRKVWMVTEKGAHLTQLKNGLPEFAITYLPRDSWDPKREKWWGHVGGDTEMFISDEHGEIDIQFLKSGVEVMEEDA